MGRNSQEIKEKKIIKGALTQTTTTTHMGARSIKLWGCKTCTWHNTPICPHGKTTGEYHKNGYCSDRILYIKEKMKLLNSVPKLIQEEEILKDILIKDKLVHEFITGGELHPDLHKYSKNVFTALKDLRKQNEGIKLSGEIGFSSHDDFRKMIDIEAKKIQERNKHTREGEFTEEIPSG